MLEDAYENLATVPGCIKTGGESVGLREDEMWQLDQQLTSVNLAIFV